MERILVTGGAGFIGHKVCIALADLGHDVIALDNFTQLKPLSPFYYDWLKERRKALTEKALLLRGDVQDLATVSKTIRDLRPDRIIHLAAVTLADEASRFIDETIGTIIRGAANLITSASQSHGLKRFTYISSSMVYGDFIFPLVSEETQKNPIEPYGGVKLAGETITRSFGKKFDISWTIVRPCAVYGPTDVNRRVLEKFISAWMFDREITVHERGESRLAFTYVDDIAKGIVQATLQEAGANEDFNINGGEAYSLMEALDIIGEILPGRPRLNSIDGGLDRPKRGDMSIQKAKDLLGYSPEFDLRKGLETFISWIQGMKK